MTGCCLLTCAKCRKIFAVRETIKTQALVRRRSAMCGDTKRRWKILCERSRRTARRVAPAAKGGEALRWWKQFSRLAVRESVLNCTRAASHGKRTPQLQIKILEDKKALGQAAADHAANSLRAALRENGVARVVAATGASQFEFLDSLTSATDIDWNRVELFHLDEYVGLPATHPASFRKYILERIILKTGIGHKTGITQYHLLDGEGDPEEVAKRVGSELTSRPVDIAFVGIGENGHLAFNDPPADFASEEPYLVLQLDEACRQQQVNEGWFSQLADVPMRAISMSIRQILRAKEIIAVVPEERKARAVQACLEEEISPMAPASALRNHPNATLYLDRDSAALLKASKRSVSQGLFRDENL